MLKGTAQGHTLVHYQDCRFPQFFHQVPTGISMSKHIEIVKT